MADATLGLKYPVLVDGVAPATGAIGSTSPEGVLGFAGTPGSAEDPLYVTTLAAGTTTLTISEGGNSGSLEVVVSAVPLVITLGEGIPE